MPKASVKRLIDNRKDKLIEFVLDIEKYPEFIPFCENSKIHEKNDNGDVINIIADLTIGKGPFKDTFKSDVKFNKKNDHIHVVNIKGPLNYMENNWKFIEKGNLTIGYKTEVIFDIDFEIKNKFLIILMDKSFQYGLEKIADSFQKRAENL
jgi:Oligoketide cyclase/lipid transport protein